MNNSTKKIVGCVVLIAAALLSTLVMYVLSYNLGWASLYDDEMPLSLPLPLIMTVPALIIYLVWFSSKATKFTNGTYVDFSAKYYQSALWFILTVVLQYLVGFLATLPLFGFYMAVSIPMLPSLLVCEVVLAVADILCYWVFKPGANEK